MFLTTSLARWNVSHDKLIPAVPSTTTAGRFKHAMSSQCQWVMIPKSAASPTRTGTRILSPGTVKGATARHQDTTGLWTTSAAEILPETSLHLPTSSSAMASTILGTKVEYLPTQPPITSLS